MQNLEAVIKEVKDLKIKAKNRSKDGLYERGLDSASEAVKKLKAFSDEVGNISDAEKLELNYQFGDCYGIMGGIYRRWGLSDNKDAQDKFVKSMENYETGYSYEKNGKPNSYNLVNRLIAQLFVEPLRAKIIDDETEFREALMDAKNIVKEQLKNEREGDFWAMADEGTLNILLKDESAANAFSDFVNSSANSHAYKSLLETFQALATLDIPQRKLIDEAIEHLEEKSPK